MRSEWFMLQQGSCWIYSGSVLIGPLDRDVDRYMSVGLSSTHGKLSLVGEYVVFSDLPGM